MPRCSICKLEKESTTECKECGMSFCTSCGNTELGFCEDCKEYERSPEDIEEEKEIIDDIQDMEQESQD